MSRVLSGLCDELLKGPLVSKHDLSSVDVHCTRLEPTDGVMAASNAGVEGVPDEIGGDGENPGEM